MLKDLHKKLDQKLVMTLLARNEEDIIEECIKFHLSHGVDFIIATDNSSIDGTRDIFLKYQEKGVLHLIDEPDHNYQQTKWVNRMIMLARDEYKADWVINVDADEFWYCNYGNLKLALPDPKKANVVFASALQVNAVDRKDFTFNIQEKVSGLVALRWKCLHNAKDYRHIVMGNHDVKMKPLRRKAIVSFDIIIFHFYIRSYKHYERKIVDSAKALLKHKNLRAGSHILDEYELYKQGRLRESFDSRKAKGKEQKNYIEGDSRLYDYVNNGYKSIDSAQFSNDGIFQDKRLSYDLLDSIKRIPARIQKKINRLKNKNENTKHSNR
ncbi:MAG: hypothetical protein ACJA0S_000454 [Rickettsiales bacterium]|jgi:hypothetical protein